MPEKMLILSTVFAWPFLLFPVQIDGPVAPSPSKPFVPGHRGKCRASPERESRISGCGSRNLESTIPHQGGHDPAFCGAIAAFSFCPSFRGPAGRISKKRGGGGQMGGFTAS
ncbi:MAG: hypothetical protein BJ554DRAFT_2599 [Olpidium bornovanus]|uniref:Secreted protein n=1 Tax=Olpidium bornovanus TaxID=278681 RepID=A0A8H8DGI9_9FUNG|nr:MAG: hypothetical protein BJ554DRAFT_2599 [Olpidium bornovanus]